jgi:beta-lactamase superfamily II metal-dependent hydrolase
MAAPKRKTLKIGQQKLLSCVLVLLLAVGYLLWERFAPAGQTQPTATPPAEGTLSVHFIDVGQAESF